MSLILDALRKLEREKRTPQRGFLVVGTPRPRGVPGALAGALAAAIVLVPLTWYMASRFAQPRALEGPVPAPPSAEPVPASPAPPALARGTVSARPDALVPPASPAPAGSESSALAPLAARRAPSPSPSAAAAFVLQAITRRDGRPLALINDRLVREGDSLDGARVVRIGDSDVELEVAGRRVVLSF